MFVLRGIYYFSAIVTIAMSVMIFVGPIGSYMGLEGIGIAAFVTLIFSLVALAVRGIIHIFEEKTETA